MKQRGWAQCGNVSRSYWVIRDSCAMMKRHGPPKQTVTHSQTTLSSTGALFYRHSLYFADSLIMHFAYANACFFFFFANVICNVFFYIYFFHCYAFEHFSIYSKNFALTVIALHCVNRLVTVYTALSGLTKKIVEAGARRHCQRFLQTSPLKRKT